MTALSSLRVSVVIPVYQRQRELDAALHSLEAEANLIHEIIVIDDASLPPIVIHEMGQLAGKVKLIRLPINQGSSASRQTGVDNSEGELIAFLDSDDVWLPGKLQSQLAHFKSSTELLAVAIGWQIDDPQHKVTGVRIPIPSSDPEDFASGSWFCPGSTVLITRESFRQVGPFDTRLRRLEDLDFFLRFALAGGRVEVANSVGVIIKKSRHQRKSDIELAIAMIKKKDYFARGNIKRALSAWLDVERAAVNYNEGKFFRAAFDIFLSHLKKPRLTGIQLKNWWS
jgi:glycosyltransferase involved in cell wall biosynthesis